MSAAATSSRTTIDLGSISAPPHACGTIALESAAESRRSSPRGRQPGVEFAVNWVRTVFVLIAVGSPVSPTLAAEVNLNKASPEQLKTACENAGGSFSQSQSGYGCGTDCHS